MKNLYLFALILTTILTTHAQITLNPNGESGSGYDAILAAGLDIESPDCVHTEFGPHVTQIMDNILDRNVFEFHSHIAEDNDRCQVFDRVRMEIKGGPGTNAESQHDLGSESYYRWKFKIPEDFKGSSSFCHIFQNKIKGGEDSGFPVITITLRTSKLEVIHNGGDTGNDLGKVVSTDIEPFLGNWIEAYIYQKHSENGNLLITLKDLKSGVELVNYSNNDIDLWRDGGEYSRPKWGVYRRKVEGLKDEIVRFSDFCISETSETLCPADDMVFVDEEAPSAPSNLMADKVTINTIGLSWEESSDNFGVTEYLIYLNGIEFLKTSELHTEITGLTGGTDYTVYASAVDAAGNESDFSNTVNVTTDPSDALPDEPTNPFPADGTEDISNTVTLRWDLGENTDSSLIFFGLQNELILLSTQAENTYSLMLESDSTYFWQIGQKNVNGVTLGPIWSFSTAGENSDGPWLVYRGEDRLDLETNFMEPRDIPEEPEIDEVMVDPLVPTNNIYQYFENSDEKFRWRYEFEDSDTAFTVVARIKGFEEAKNVGYFEIRLGGVRDKLRINHDNFKLEKSTPVIESDIPFDFDADFHIVRVTMEDQVMTVYVDENPVPFAVGYSEESDGGSNFEFGKSGGTPTGSFVDWMTILPNQAYGPKEGPELPSDFILSNDATLSELQINGLSIEGFSSNAFEYTVTLNNSELPTINLQTSFRKATTNIEISEEDEFFTATIKVVAQDNFNTHTYLITMLKSEKDNGWDVYRANARLDLETSFYEPKDIPVNPELDTILVDPNGSGNNFYMFADLSDDQKFRWRYRLEEQDTAFTVVARIKGINPDVKNITFFEVRSFGWREKIKINHNTIKFERSEPLVEESYNFDFDEEFHLVRVVMKGNETTMYLDENPEPFAIAVSGDDDSNHYFDFGKLGGSECGSIVDWIAILPNQDKGPGEGPTLPEDLFLSSVASLNSISLDGEVIPDFDPDSLIYDLTIENSALPAIEVTTQSDLANVRFDTTSVENLTTVTITVTAQDGFTQANYILKFMGTSSVDGIIAADKVVIYPNPTNGSFQIKSPEFMVAEISIFTMAGQKVFYTKSKGQVLINQKFDPGVYVLSISLNAQENIYKKLIVK
ncbi:T9SS type A sorting domain-containing protein [Portibacter marinus]|uniref:T9SS type A sorting domain-containing protein n=1 Tax=Portibacter marinus TaxID=2898660 RepID=UPI001F3029EE|nr:T9SS type A sorting domain-containing protein [Portibacter marinus]